MWTEALKQGKDGIFVDLEVNPGSKRLGIIGYEPWRKRITLDLRARPKGGEANAELVRYLAKLLELPSGQIIISSGHTSGHKRVLVKGLDMDALKDKLRNAIGPE
jgi:uncharacterized protein (TIGR00251 family)